MAEPADETRLYGTKKALGFSRGYAPPSLLELSDDETGAKRSINR